MIWYGVNFPADVPANEPLNNNSLIRELFFFRNNANQPGYNGEGTYYHAKQVCDMLWRQPGNELFEWHEWLEDALESYCTGRREILLTGPASGGKTFGAAIYALLFWMSDQANSGVIACSTTKDGLKKRLWGEIRRLYKAAENVLGGNLIDSQICIQSTKGETKRGIFGIAVAGGEEQKAMGRIIGFHPPNLLVIVDELTDVSMAIVEACTNLSTGKIRYQFIGIGNACSIFDSHGKLCEPKGGWNSVNVNTEKWETKRGGIGLHFDGFNSPNIKSGKIQFKFLLTQEDINNTIRDYGENSPQMWRMRRGWWCPEGVVKSVLSEILLQKFRAMDKITWRESFTRCASLDPAFEGGDKCVLKFGRFGVSSDGTDTLQFEETLIIKVDATSKEPIHYQIARQVKDECTKRGVDPYYFAMDVTGEGGGLASIISETWGFNFHKVEFGGRASEMPVSPSDARICRDIYANKVTELWYSFREYVQRNQIRGLDAESAVEFCNRLYFSETRIRVESKSDMKTRPNGRSPDNADACVVMLDLVKHRGGFGAMISRARNSANRAWEKLLNEMTPDDETAFTHDPVMNI